MATKTLITLLLAGGAIAGNSCPVINCTDSSAISDYTTLRLREVGARNTLVSPFAHVHGSNVPCLLTWSVT